MKEKASRLKEKASRLRNNRIFFLLLKVVLNCFFFVLVGK